MPYLGVAPNPRENREVDDISGSFNGSTTAFTLQAGGSNVSPGKDTAIIVSLGGVVQNPGTDYTIAASTITFTTAPASGLSFFGVVLAQSIDIETVADNTVTTSKIVNDAVTADKLAHTSVTAGSYTTADITVDAQGRITAAASGTIANAEIADGAVNNAKVNASAAIAGSKISPDFGSQAISTTGGLSINGATVFNESGADVDFRIEGDTQASLFKVDAGNDRIGVGEGTPSVVFHATQFGHAFADSTSSLATVPTKSVARFRGSNNASGSLFIGNESTAAKCYLQGCNDTGNGSIDILLNPFGANVGIGTISPSTTLSVSGTSDGVLNLDTSDSRGAFVRFGQGGSFHNMVGCADGITSGDKEDLGVRAADNIIFASGGSTERMRINSNGDIMAGRTSVFSGARLSLEKSGTCLGIRQAANADNNSIEMTHVFATSGSTNAFQISFRDASGNQRGSITNTTSTTSYNTSSDYRLKENEVLISDGITRLKTLKPYKFNWKAEPSTIVDGFFAHEVSDAVPEAVVGEKDASIGEDGKGYQQIDHSKLVPLLTASLQEAITKIETLETKVAALEAA